MLALAAVPAFAQAPPESLDVADCVRLARERSPEALAAAAEWSAARFDSAALAHPRRPSYALFGGATVAPRGYYDPVITNLGEYSVKLGFEWPVLDAGAKRRDASRGALGARQGLAAKRVSDREVALEAGTLALTCLRLAEAEAAQGEAVAWLERLLAEMDLGVRAGARGRSDALRVALERDAASAELSDTHREADDTARELGRWLGLPPDARPRIRPPHDAVSETPTVRDSMPEAQTHHDSVPEAPTDNVSVPEAPTANDSLRVLAAFEQGPDPQLAALEEARARLDLDEAEQRNRLQVDVLADAGLAGSDLTRAVPEDLLATQPGATFGDRLHRDLGASAGLQFRLPLADVSQPSAIVARRAALDASAIRRAAALDAQRRAAIDLLSRWRGAATRFAAATASLERAEEHLLRMRSLYAAGATTLLELLDARRLHDEARGRLTDARFELRHVRLTWEVR